MASDHPPRILSARTAVLVATALVLSLSPVAAQTERIALDLVGSADGDAGSSVPRSSGVWIDVFGAYRLFEGFDVLARPVILRRTFDGSWTKQMYQLGVRYERPGDGPGGLRSIGLRIDAGYMPMPIGLGMLENRQDLNPVISQHSAYYLPLTLRDVDRGIPRLFLIAGSYPLGAQATLAKGVWDARVAAIDASPVRGRSMFGSSNIPRMLNWVGGFGVTPHIGLRFGAGFGHGPYVAASELADPSAGDRIATMVQAEGEWSFGYTRIAGEVVRAKLETPRGTHAATRGGWIEATQTLHPRLFVAGRADAQGIDYVLLTDPALQEYFRYEAVAGFKVTPDVTLRAGFMTRWGYVVRHWDDQFLASITYQRKIF
jgi:hypothetical protein